MRSYGKVWNLGHKSVVELFMDPVTIEEKVDGSQFSMMVADDGTLFCRSHRADLNTVSPEKMFVNGIETARRLAPLLRSGWTYRCEYLGKPKHNTLAYSRIPKDHLILFDVDKGEEQYVSYDEKNQEAERIGLEVVPKIFEGTIHEPEKLRELLGRVSVLGGSNVEGIVIKNYNRFGPDGKALMGKLVSSEFRESHRRDWMDRNPKSGDIVKKIGESYRTPARWQKAIQHLREAGQIENDPSDIGKIIAEIGRDLEEEEKGNIKELLYKWAIPNIARNVRKGFPEWYKEQLLKLQF